MLDFIHDPGLHELVVGLFRVLGRKSQVLGLHDFLGPGITCHDDNRILEVHLAALGIRNPAIVKDLQEDIEYIGVGLFNLVEENDGVRVLPHLLGELTALLVADIARRRADHLCHGLLLHVFGHVDPDHLVLIAENRFGQGLGDLGLSDAGGTQEEEGTDRPVGGLEADPAPADCPGDSRYCLLLADNPLVQGLFQFRQPMGLGFIQFRDRNPGPDGDDLRHVFRSQGNGLSVLRPVIGLLQALDFGQILLPVLSDLCRVGKALFGQGLLEVGLGIVGLGLEIVDFLRRPGILQAKLGCSFIHEVNGFVRQEAVGDVAGRKLGTGVGSSFRNRNAVVLFVLALDTGEYGLGLLDRGLLHHDGLEAAFKSRILFDILMIFADGRGPDDLQFSPGHGRFQDVRGIEGAFGPAGPDNRMDLVNEKNNIPGGDNFIHEVLDPLFELTPVLGPGHHAGHVHGDNPLGADGIGHETGLYILGQALDDSRLSDAGLPDEAGIVLAPTGKDLNDPLNFLLPPDDRVQFPLPAEFRKVP